MLLKFVQVACGLSLFSFSLAQDRFFSENPIAEEEALSHIIEDKPGDLANKKKDWISPEYSLIYRQALPIPPVKQPKQ
jgi:bilirubin oxidase